MSKEQGMKTTALLTKMDSPVGNTVGHALEVAEAVDCLHGNGPRPLVELTATLGQLFCVPLYNVVINNLVAKLRGYVLPDCSRDQGSLACTGPRSERIRILVVVFCTHYREILRE